MSISTAPPLGWRDTAKVNAVVSGSVTVRATAPERPLITVSSVVPVSVGGASSSRIVACAEGVAMVAFVGFDRTSVNVSSPSVVVSPMTGTVTLFDNSPVSNASVPPTAT